ncbi:glutathione S-transferase N-terminal domain-containing protein [Terasakiella sp. A23]|uniref:glutathione S-transferase family protein n=1 Tax=Terasakiella sp. FCG-A23 TaxID=3080561 RepID=UPI0029532BB7|nr:glutathione S-transferase N-terminal domain-containing protein [Terasakiella sp. A23]MDV7341643.1 glutathione S-transferase N-terminal domain-containing protein [Terasakiella sp. A23]
MFKLFYLPDTASLAPHIVLNRLGAARELIELNKKDGSLQNEEYQKLNPNRRVPTLIDGNLVLFESVAICMHLADSDPDSGLMPPLGSAKRANAYKWLVFMTNSIQADMMLYFYKERFSKTPDGALEVRDVAIERVTTFMSRIDDALSDGRPFLSGANKTIVEDYLLMLSRWFVQMGQEEKLKSMAHLYALLCVLEDDVHVKAAYETEGCEPLFL